MIFAVRQVQEKCIEQDKVLYSVFVDLAKTFDTVNRVALWTLLERHGWPKTFVRLIHLLHDGMTGQLLCSRDTAAAFVFKNGVIQGFVLAPALFNLFFTFILPHAVRFHGGGYLPQTSECQDKVPPQLIQEALFADGCALLVHKIESCSRC